MGNVYNIVVNEDKLLDITDNQTFIVHSSRNYDMMLCLQREGISAKDIPKHFCGYCGSYVALTETECSCGHLKRQ